MTPDDPRHGKNSGAAAHRHMANTSTVVTADEGGDVQVYGRLNQDATDIVCQQLLTA